MINKAGFGDFIITPLFNKLGLLKVYDIYRQQTLVFIYKFNKRKTTSRQFLLLFYETTTVHSDFTRNSVGLFLLLIQIIGKCIRHSGS